MKKKIILFFTLVLLLGILSFNFISVKGKVYTIRLNNYNFENININSIITSQNGNSVTLIDKKIEGKDLLLKYRSVKRGTSEIEIETYNYYSYQKLYVSHFGIISIDNIFGDSSGDEVIAISLCILICVLIIMVYDSYKKSINKNMYQYKNMYLLGLIIFLIFIFLRQFLNIFDYKGIVDSINKYIDSYRLLSYIVFPVGLITFLFVSISNIILIKKEGFSIRNMLGIILGLLLIIITILPEIMYRFTYSDLLINIHNMSSISYHIYVFVESFIYSLVSYLECILLSLIILSIKAGRRIPKFNKDYIIILGCMINKDKSLPPLLKSRVDRAIEFSKLQKKSITFIGSGGKGNDEPISEGQAIKNYLISSGIDKKKIIVEDKSTNTYENFMYSLKKVKVNKNIAFSTTNYHVFRSGVEASKFDYNIEGIGSKTKRYFWINAFIREFLATLYYERKRHFIIFSLLLVVNIIMIILLYLSNTL